MGKSLISDNRHPKLKLASSPSRKLLALSRHVEETETVLPKPDPRPDPRPDLRFDLASIKRARELCEMLRQSKVTQEESAKLQPRYNSKDLLERHRKLTYKGFKVEEKRAQPEGEESRSRGKAGLFESGSLKDTISTSSCVSVKSVGDGGGLRLGEFQMVKYLAQGKFGSVYLAR